MQAIKKSGAFSKLPDASQLTKRTKAGLHFPLSRHGYERSGKALHPVSRVRPGARHSATSKILPQQNTEQSTHSRISFLFRNKPTGKIGCLVRCAQYSTPLCRCQPFFYQVFPFFVPERTHWVLFVSIFFPNALPSKIYGIMVQTAKRRNDVDGT